MRLTRKQAAVASAFAVAVLAMVLLISSISETRLEPGVPFAQLWQFLISQFRRNGVLGPAPPLAGGGTVIAIMRAVFYIALACLPIAIILVLIDPEMRKRALRIAIQMILLAIVLSLFVRPSEEPAELEPEGFFGQMLEAESPPVDALVPDEAFDADNVSPWVSRVLTGAIALIVATLAYFIITQVRRSMARRAPPLSDIAAQAQLAVAEIERGSNLHDTILRCYADMTRIVREQRGVRRDSAVTAREFADYLSRAGLPDEPVRRLTSLFEKARYGDGITTLDDEREAIASFTAISEACRSSLS
mgnify:CR=1 FL=1